MNALGEMLKQRRVALSLTLREVARAAGISPSHLGRVEQGQRFPSGQILRRIAAPLRLDEKELFTLAGLLSPFQADDPESEAHPASRLDPHVARLLAEEPPEVQRSVIGILSILHSLARSQAP